MTVGALGSSGLSAEEDSFTYTIDDGNGGTATGTVNLTLIDTKDSNAVGQLDNIDLSQYTAYYQTANEEVPSEAFSYIDAKGGNDSIVGSEGNDILIGGDNDDTLIGGDGDDRLFGNAGADSLVGGDGDDYLDGGTGANILVGDAGDDLLIFRDQNTTENGGGDFDILKFDTGINFNATTANLAGITNIEMVDLENSAADSFGQSGGLGGANRLSASEVISMTDDDNILYILGEAGDSVYLNTGTGWTVGAPAEFQGVMFNTYTSGGATLYIDQDILSANINIA
ncbi:MAG: hypothetical protein HY526_07395 [Betaproteobacteria bacterium]|nr:hypothetical protein [Betaproteobacteria bacterium]